MAGDRERVTMSDYNALQMGEFVRYIEGLLKLNKNINLLDIYSFRVVGGDFHKLLRKKTRVYSKLDENLQAILDFKNKYDYDIDIRNACIVIIANYKTVMCIVEDHIDVLNNVIASVKQDEIDFLDGTISDDELPF